MTDAGLLDALRDCYEPILRRNVVDAGLIKTAALTLDTEAPGANIPGVPPRYIAHITFLAPGADEAANTQLAAQIENRLMGIAAISRVILVQLPALFPIL
jgi:hypothetical protein